jgi:predicted metal-dependent HD superfamily phosphohydrolase
MHMTLPDFESAARHAIEQLEQKLPVIYTYHSLKHTRDEVVGMAERLAIFEGIDGVERILLITGAYFHDIGFTQQRVNHEMVGVDYVNRVLPQFGYTSDQLKVISGIIMATRIPQTPHNLLEEIVADADLDSLGRVDFWNRSLALRSEMAMLGQYFTDQEWCERQRGFLRLHHYFTASAKRLRDEQKQANINFMLARCQESCPEVSWVEIG